MYIYTYIYILNIYIHDIHVSLWYTSVLSPGFNSLREVELSLQQLLAQLLAPKPAHLTTPPEPRVM